MTDVVGSQNFSFTVDGSNVLLLQGNSFANVALVTVPNCPEMFFPEYSRVL